MKKKATLSGLILIFIVTVSIAHATESVFQIQDGEDDLFMTASGNVFKTTELIVLQDPTYDSFVFIRFTGVTIPYSANINEAILSFRTESYYNDSATGLDVTIYGIKEANCAAFGDTADLNTRKTTTKYKNWDISNVKGLAWHNVTVKNILEELVIQYGYSSGNAMGFKILCDAEGYQRTFKAYEYNPSHAVKLYVTYNEAPPPEETPPDLPPDVEWYADYRNYSIWRRMVYFNNTDTWLRVSGTSYKALNWDTTEKVQITSDLPEHPDFSGLDNLVRIGKYIIFANYLNLFISEDEGETWTDLGDIRNEYPALTGKAGRRLGLYVDRVHDPTRIYMAWGQYNATLSTYGGVYAYFEIATNGTLIFYDYDYYTSETVEEQDIHVDHTGRLWIAYCKYIYSGGEVDIIRLFTKFDNGTKTSLIDITTQTANIRCTRPQIVVTNSTDEDTVYAYVSYQHYYWYATSEHRIKGRLVYYNLTLGSINNIAGGTGYADAQPHTLVINWAVSPNMAFLVYGQQTGASYHAIALKYLSVYPGGGWSSVEYVTSTSQQHYYPDCSLDYLQQVLAIIWRNTWNARTDKRIYNMTDLSWATSQTIYDTSTPTYVGCNKYFMENENYFEYWVTDENGTIVNGDPCLTVDCAEDKIDDDIGPDPEDPNPDEWAGDPIGRFRLRLSFLIMGFVMIFGPVWFFCYRRPGVEAVIGGILVMLIGLAFLITVGQI